MEKSLMICLAASVLGILLLLFLANFLSPKTTDLGNITDQMLNQKVRVQGQIFNIRSYEDSNFQVISIKDKTGKIDVTAGKILNLTNSQTLIVLGSVSEYQGNLQIQADKIIKK
jgi:DNA/RNA endonuclease YhcR with UshA esterase domain